MRVYRPNTFLRRSIVLGLVCLSLCCRSADHEDSVENRLSEFLAAEPARPLLLQDHRELLSYLKDFPRSQYNLATTQNGFSFFIDKAPHLDGIKEIISSGGVWEAPFIDLMAKHIRPGSAVIDAGAYIGTHSLAMAELVGRAGRVYAFEPQKKVFRELLYNLIENDVRNVIPLRFALGENNRIVEMDIPVDGREGLVKVGRGGDPVELRTLDSFHLSDVSFLKIDVEGYDDQVLQGARQTIAENRPVMLIENVGSGHRLEDYGYAVTPLEHRDYLALPAPAYRPGSIISFMKSGNSGQFQSGPWSAEAWGAWTTGQTAHLVLPLPYVPRNDLILVGLVKAYVNERNPRQEIEVLANGRTIDRWVFRDRNRHKKRTIIPASCLGEFAAKPLLRITFQVKNPVSPAELKLSADPRPLGLGVYEIVVREL